jgi:hypothetical protein
MGSPLGLLFANIFMSHLEKKHMGTLKKLGVLMWKRYVDDVLAIVKDKQSARTCLEFLNKLHKNIEFTIEHEQNNQLAFLDTYVKRNSDRYAQQSITKRHSLNWTSLTARRYKIGLIRCMLSRIHAICTEQVDNAHTHIYDMQQFI